MKKLDTLTFSGQNQTVSLPSGKISLTPRHRLPWLELEVSLTLANSGAAAALTPAQILTFLSAFKLNLKYGKKRRNPYNFVTWDVLRNISRDALGNDFPYLTDSTIGLAQNFTGSATCIFYVQVPLGYDWKDDSMKDLSGMGPYQASTVSIDISRGAETLPANWSVSGNINCTVVLPEKPSRFELFDPVPEYLEYTESNSIANLPSGLPKAVWEKTHPLSSNESSNVSVRVNGETIHDQVNSREIGTQFTSDPELPSSAQWTDAYSPLLAYNSRDRLREQAIGDVQIQQNVKDLSSMSLGHYFRPLISEQDMRDEVTAAAQALRREVRAVSAADAVETPIPAELKAFVPVALLEAADADGMRLPSLRATENTPAHPDVPNSVKIAAQNRIRAEGGRGTAAAIHEANKIAFAIPGGNSNPGAYRKTGQAGPSATVNAVYSELQK